MTDTATTPAPKTKTLKPRDVNYDLEILEGELPDPGVRPSPLEDGVATVIGDPQYHGKWVRIGHYANNTAAGASANVLRQRHGKTVEAEGLEFAAKKVPGDTSGRTGLFVRYSPDKLVPGAKDKHDAAEKARKEKLAQKKEAEKSGADVTKDQVKATTEKSQGTARS